MTDADWVRIGEICRPDRRIITGSNDDAGSRPFLGLEHIEPQSGRIIGSAAGQGAGAGTTFAFDARHILYGKLRPYLNKVAEPDFEGRCSTELIPLLPEEGVDRGYLAFLLRRSETVAAAMLEKTGSRMPRAGLGAVMNLRVPLPPVEVQRAIAAALRSQLVIVDRARAGAEARVEAARALEDSLLRVAFHGIVPLAVANNRDRAPDGWRWVRLTSLARLESGHTPSRYHPEWWGGDIPWIALPDIRKLDGRAAMETTERTNPDGIANSSARVLPAGTVVLSRTASVGFVTVMGREMATSQDFVNWVCGPELEPWFLAHLLRRSRAYLRSLSSGAVHQTIYVPTVEAFDVCVPEPREQRGVVRRLDVAIAHARVAAAEAEVALETVKALPAALLRRAFAGQQST